MTHLVISSKVTVAVIAVTDYLFMPAIGHFAAFCYIVVVIEYFLVSVNVLIFAGFAAAGGDIPTFFVYRAVFFYDDFSFPTFVSDG